MEIPTTAEAISRGSWLKDKAEIIYNGPGISSVTKKDFKRIRIAGNENISMKFLKNRLRFLKKLERRPVFIHANCTGCNECIRICPVNAISFHPGKKNHVILTDRKCIRCFCCSEVCQSDAVKTRHKFFGR
jgi:ferredoxin